MLLISFDIERLLTLLNLFAVIILYLSSYAFNKEQNFPNITLIFVILFNYLYNFGQTKSSLFLQKCKNMNEHLT